MGDQNWGKMALDSSEEGRSKVYDFGNANARTYTLTENKYGSGSGSAILQIRGSSTPFNQDDISPSWETYTIPINREWQYIQVREIKNE